MTRDDHDHDDDDHDDDDDDDVKFLFQTSPFNQKSEFSYQTILSIIVYLCFC